MYTVTSYNVTHFSISSTSKAASGAWWHRGLAWGVLDADFPVTGRLSISFPAGEARINASIVDQAACAAGQTQVGCEVFIMGRSLETPVEPTPTPVPTRIPRVLKQQCTNAHPGAHTHPACSKTAVSGMFLSSSDD